MQFLTLMQKGHQSAPITLQDIRKNYQQDYQYLIKTILSSLYYFQTIIKLNNIFSKLFWSLFLFQAQKIVLLFRKSIIQDQRQLMLQSSQSPYSSILSLQGICNICFNTYDLDNSKPLLICLNDHSVCKQCLLAIKNNRLRCPFCRIRIRLDRIRLNYSALNAAKARTKSEEVSIKGPNSNRMSQIDERSQNKHKNNQIHYPNTARQSRMFYLDASEFLSSGVSPSQSVEESIQLNSSNECCQKIWDILVFVNILSLQLPINIFNFVVAFHYSNKGCFNCTIPNTTYSLQSYWLTVGFFEVIIPLLGLYFLAVHLTSGIIDEEGLKIFEGLLTVIIEIKSVVQFINYLRLLQSEMYWIYSPFIVEILKANVIINSLSMVLGIFIIAKYGRDFLESRL